MIYHEIQFNELTYWYRVAGNKYGWSMYIQKPSTPQMPLRPSLKFSFWEQPINKREKIKFWNETALENLKQFADKI